MKATGIVRRIDDLGRVVIPKEIRRTLRIREGDPLEIFVDHDGEVILKKYSPISGLTDFAKEYAESLYSTLKHTVVISDRDQFIAAAGGMKKEFLDQAVGEMVETSMESRKMIIEQHLEHDQTVDLIKGGTDQFTAYVIAPIIAAGDPIGTVLIVTQDSNVKMGEIEQKMAETAAGFLAKQMES